MKKRILAALTLAFLPTLGVAPTALAVDEAMVEQSALVQTWQITAEENLPGNDELFAGYVEQTLYGDNSIMPLGLNAVNSVFADDPVNQKFYELLKVKIVEVAKNGGSTQFTISLGDLGVTKTGNWADFGCNDYQNQEERHKAIAKACPINVDVFKVLLLDCPYEMYWCDKSASNAFQINGPSYSYNSQGFTLDDSLEVSIRVGAGYRDNENINSVKPAIANVSETAQEIVDKYKGQSAFDRLQGYKDEICALVSYDVDAANGSSADGVNPWQIVNVFDKDPETNVVCEGYAKAFQYLCDLDGAIDCYTVTGEMSGGTGAGPHMWNVVRLNGKNYLVDLTNCDEGSVGMPDKLFLKAPDSGDVTTGYSFALPNTITYAYDEEIKAIWGNSILTLATTDYNPDETPDEVLVSNVSLNKTTLTMQIDGTEVLTATVLPAAAANKDVTWQSDNTAVVTVDRNGKVTAVGVGSATVTVTTVEGKKTATCKINVAAAVVQPVADVKLDKTALSMNKGDTVVLNATVMPTDANNKAVKWNSSDKSVVTVDENGKLTAVKSGTATITVTTVDGNKTAKCEVTVNSSSVKLDKNVLAMIAGSGRTITLTADVDTKLTDKTVVWTSSNPAVATVVNGTVTAHAAGTATIIATMNADSDAKAECVVTVSANPENKGVYVVTFDANGGIIVGESSVQVLDGTKYKMPAASKKGYNFRGWQRGSDTKNVTAAGAVYTITADTDFIAVWGTSGGGGSSHRPGISGGTTTPTKPEKPGETTKPGTSTDNKTVTAANINNKFADVQNNAWYSEAIAYVYNNGMMNGTDGGKFEPNATTTRAMLVTMLHRLENEPVTGASRFSDVASGQWFSEAVAWAAANGVVNGYENGTFAPNASITREQLAAVLYRFAQFKGYDVTAKGILNSFSDSAEVSGWAKEAMQWAVGVGIINGDSNALKPAGNATRAEVAMMLMRFCEEFK